MTSFRRTWEIPSCQVYLSNEDCACLSEPISDQEIKNANWSMKSFKASRPDGLHTGFFQRFWLLVSNFVIEAAQGVFHSGKVPENLNKTLITLIPKHPDADCLSNYRPISLCNTVYKAVSKVIIVRLRPYLADLVSPMQTAFVLGRKGIDNMVIVQEILHSMSRNKGSSRQMAIKIDLEKAYDRLEWSFIRDTLALFKVPKFLLNVIMSCVTSPSIFVLFNGGALEDFRPTREIRQVDPLLPYIFIMCMEVLGFLIKDKCDSKLWNLVKASRGGPAFSHLFFADDLVFFGKADMKNCQSMKDALDVFCDLSREKVSLSKSRVYFSTNVPTEKRAELCSCLELHSTPNLGKYLGFPLKQHGSSKHDFDFVIEQVQSKLAGWKAHLLSFASRVVLT